jgi:hypothetical protein
MDEAEDAREELGIRTLEMHISALSATTRATHAARHGKLYTTDEEREWWSKDGNSFSCKCSRTSVLVDSKNQPLVPEVIARAKAIKQKMEKRDYNWSKD